MTDHPTPSMTASPPPSDAPSLGAPVVARSRCLLAVLGWAFVALGVVGAALPGLPTTVFLLAAFWAFSRSSPRFEQWLWTHPRLGPPVRNWHTHRVVPVKAKLLATASMAASLAILVLLVADGWVLPTAVGAVMAAVLAYLLTRPSRVPTAPPTILLVYGRHTPE